METSPWADPRIIIIHQLFFSRSDVEWGAKGASAAAHSKRKEGGVDAQELADRYDESQIAPGSVGTDIGWIPVR